MKREFEDYLIKFLEGFKVVRDEESSLENYIFKKSQFVRGLLDMYKATGDARYLNDAQPYMVDVLSYDARHAAEMAKNILTLNTDVIDGQLLEKIHEVSAFYKSHVRNQKSVFAKQDEFETDKEELNQFSFFDFSRVFPFLAAYENKLNGHFGYEDIYKQLFTLRQFDYCQRLSVYADVQTSIRLGDSHETIKTTIAAQALMIFTLVDTSEQMHEAIFEYYKGVRDLAKEAIVNYFELKTNAKQRVSEGTMEEIEKNLLFDMSMIPSQSLLAYGVLKAALLNIVSEKYAKIGFEIFENDMMTYLNKEKNGMLKDIDKQQFEDALGTIMSAYAMVLKLEKQGMLVVKEEMCDEV